MQSIEDSKRKKFKQPRRGDSRPSGPKRAGGDGACSGGQGVAWVGKSNAESEVPRGGEGQTCKVGKNGGSYEGGGRTRERGLTRGPGAACRWQCQWGSETSLMTRKEEESFPKCLKKGKIGGNRRKQYQEKGEGNSA